MRGSRWTPWNKVVWKTSFAIYSDEQLMHSSGPTGSPQAPRAPDEAQNPSNYPSVNMTSPKMTVRWAVIFEDERIAEHYHTHINHSVAIGGKTLQDGGRAMRIEGRPWAARAPWYFS